MTSANQTSVQQPVQQSKRAKVLAIIGCIASILCLAICWIRIPVINGIAIIVALISLIVSFLAIASMARVAQGIHVFAIVGAAFSAVALLISLSVDAVAVLNNRSIYEKQQQLANTYKDEAQLKYAYIKLDGITITKQDGQKPTLHVEVTWKNTSEGDGSIDKVTKINAFQNGKVLYGGTYQHYGTFKEVKTGQWRTDDVTYVLDDTSSDVTVICADTPEPIPHQHRLMRKFSVQTGKPLD
ncbi:hypothetical protein D2E26_1352 [Bifidobacterium dolichotidis]|uniref:DUF5067 domain-containing protein n=1 Tax=Bifidobacterium dolichotidis TaxID=2306976 RepID=A0A430FNZ1_9BIFI|nr:DUF5067 domain-containing protein [Bifidobacterium dolichotidis]RSX54552.1 hypothetical protein D2E26_1352 [Bifidobacterium dolichotidis]